MKFFTILNLMMAKDYSTMSRITAQGKKFIFISTVSPEAPEYMVADSPLNIDTLYLKFHDINESGDVRSLYKVDYDNLIPFDTSMATQILDFVEKYEDIDYILVNCEAGMSRSAGIAMALSEIYNGSKNPELFLTTLYDWKMHNFSIKEMLLNTHKIFRRKK